MFFTHHKEGYYLPCISFLNGLGMFKKKKKKIFSLKTCVCVPHTHLTVFVSTEATLIVTFNIYTDSLSPSSVVSKDDTTNPAHAWLLVRSVFTYLNMHSLIT